MSLRDPHFSLLRVALEAPERVALVDSEREWRFGELAPLVAAEVAALQRSGLGVPGGPPRIRLTAIASRSFLLRFFALLELGVTVVPVHPALRSEERAALAAADPVAWDLDTIPEATVGSCCLAVLQPAPPPERALAVVATSGSTGTPRGVALSRRAFAASAAASARLLGWRDDDRWLLALPPAHVGGLSVLTRCLAARRAVVLADGRDPRALLDAIGRHRVTLASLVAPQLRRLLDALVARPVRHALRAVLVGGGPCPAELLVEAREAGVPALATYGLTETCSQVATQPPGCDPREVGAAAPPLPGVELRIVAGRIQVRGEMLMSGYLPRGRYDEPFTADGYLDTGDLGELDERGWLRVLGRADEQIVTGGENVAPAEVEAVLLGFPGVREALVFGLPDTVWGSLVAAAVVTAGGRELDEASLAEHLAGRLAPFKRPRRLAVVAALPATAAGKPDRRSAPQELAARLHAFPA